MSIDWNHFTPAGALAGGVLIGLGTAGLLLGIGRIAGVSGIVAALCRSLGGESGWRCAFVAGLLLAPVAWLWLVPGGLPGGVAVPVNWQGWAQLAVAGLLVGFGSRVANGCTSGHGVCGLARLSPRSLAAVLTFMGSGFATVFVSRHLLGA